MEKIALIGPYDPEIRELIKAQAAGKFSIFEIGSEAEYDRLKDADYVILRTLTLREPIIRKHPQIKLIQRWGAGFDTVDIEAAAQEKIPVAVTSGMNAPSVSEMAILLMLAVYRKLPLLHQNVLEGKWRGEEGIASSSYVIDGKVVGLMGMGAIGKMVAKKVQEFGATVQYYDLFQLSAEEEKSLNVRCVDQKELLETSDIISLHLPLSEDTRNIINRETIELMKRNAVIINTARGGIINEEDLVDALNQGRILGAGLDVVSQEPLLADSLLAKAPNVVLTPHMGGSTFDVNTAMVKRCLENIEKVSRKEELLPGDFVNKKYF